MKPGYYLVCMPACFADYPPIYGAFMWTKELERQVQVVRHTLRELSVEVWAANQINVLFRGQLYTFEYTDELGIPVDQQLKLETQHDPIKISKKEFCRIAKLEETYRTDCDTLEVFENGLYLVGFGKYCGMKFGTKDLEGV